MPAVPDNLDEAASEMISGMNQGMEKVGLHSLLQVPALSGMYGRLNSADFYHAAISVLKCLIEVAEGKGLTPIVQDHSQRLAVAQSLLEKELARTPIPVSPSDAEPTMRRDSETGRSYVLHGGGLAEGGYVIELSPDSPDGENRMVR